MFLLYSESERSYSNANNSSSLLLPNTVNSKNRTDSDELTNGLFDFANDNVLNEPIAVGDPPSDLLLI